MEKYRRRFGRRTPPGTKKCGIAVADMVKSPWVYRRLRNFRAGIEAGISCFKRAYGAARCTWRGLDHFKTYIWSAVELPYRPAAVFLPHHRPDR